MCGADAHALAGELVEDHLASGPALARGGARCGRFSRRLCAAALGRCLSRDDDGGHLRRVGQVGGLIDLRMSCLVVPGIGNYSSAVCPRMWRRAIYRAGRFIRSIARCDSDRAAIALADRPSRNVESERSAGASWPARYRERWVERRSIVWPARHARAAWRRLARIEIAAANWASERVNSGSAPHSVRMPAAYDETTGDVKLQRGSSP